MRCNIETFWTTPQWAQGAIATTVTSGLNTFTNWAVSEFHRFARKLPAWRIRPKSSTTVSDRQFSLTEQWGEGGWSAALRSPSSDFSALLSPFHLVRRLACRLLRISGGRGASEPFAWHGQPCSAAPHRLAVLFGLPIPAPPLEKCQTAV